MTRLYQSFLVLLASATDRELARHVQYLREENRMLRTRLPRRLTLTERERQRLLKFGRPVGAAIYHLISIVAPRTFARWLTAATGERKSGRRRGRPRSAEPLRELVLRLARENCWGHTRLHGELRKLGQRISRSTVARILRENGVDPGPRRGPGTWDDFIKRHAATLWACDFFSKKVWTRRGLVECFVWFFIHVASRRVVIAGVTANPDRAWMAQRAIEMVGLFEQQPVRPRYLIRDLDDKFDARSDAVFENAGVTVVPVGPLAPNLSAHAERWVLSIKSECLDHFVVFGDQHLRYLIDEYVAHYHTERPHQGKGNVPLTGATEAPASVSTNDIVCDERLGGLLRHYRRAA
jgi:putative transposase